MRLLRLRFREFLLIVTLVSLITAAVAIDEKTATQLSTQEHLSLATRARSFAKELANRIPEVKRQARSDLMIWEGWPAHHRLSLVPPVTEPDELPKEGRNLIVVTDLLGLPWLRIFDAEGKIVVDHRERSHPLAANFKDQISNLLSPHRLFQAEQERIIDMVASSVKDRQNWLSEYANSLETRRDKANAEAEAYERLARRL